MARNTTKTAATRGKTAGSGMAKTAHGRGNGATTKTASAAGHTTGHTWNKREMAQLQSYVKRGEEAFAGLRKIIGSGSGPSGAAA